MRKIRDNERQVSTPLWIEDGMTLQEICESHDRFIETTSVKPETIELDKEVGWDGESDSFAWIGIRDETAAEEKRRQASERQARTKAGERRKAKEAEERKEFIRLMKKFGDKS